MFFVVLLISVGVSTFSAEAKEGPKCSEKDHTPVLLQDEDCSKYWKCVNGKAYLLECPNGLHFNKNTFTCEWPHIALCSNDASSEELDSYERDDIILFENNIYETCNTSEVHCPTTDGQQPVYFPLPNCAQFCQCSNGVPYLHNCPADLHFNPTLNVCDYPQNAGCANGNGTDDKPSITTDSSKGDDSDPAITTEGSIGTTESEYELCPDTVAAECPAVDGDYPVYIPLPDCTKFCQCSNGLPYLHNCPDGLHFNPVLNVCDWPEDAGCAGGNGTDVISTTESAGGDDAQPSTTTESSGGDDSGPAITTEESAGTTESGGTTESEYELCPDTVASECPAVDGDYPVYIPLPDCTKFCQCSNGLPYLYNCPADLHFNPVLNVCDYPENAQCSSIPS